jgi:hypothetical protein
MDIFGIDFTSTPKRNKPLTCLHCVLNDDNLQAGELQEWQSFSEFEKALSQPGPWIAGLDFPFGQARRFIETIGWPDTWQGYTDYVGTMDRKTFRVLLDDYRAGRPAGDKEHKRACDKAAGSISPQKLYGTPVGLMFFEGAPRLRKSGVSIPGLQEGDPNRIVVEAYPGMLARSVIGRRPYKQDTKAKQTQEQHEARHDMLKAILEGDIYNVYGIRVEAPLSLTDDPSGDQLDALLCCIQAAWAWKNRSSNYGMLDDMDVLEGWIADPHFSN